MASKKAKANGRVDVRMGSTPPLDPPPARRPDMADDGRAQPGGLTRRRFLRDTSLAVTYLSVPAVWGSVQPDARPATEHDAAVPLAWYALALELTRTTPGFSPPVASRAFGYLGLTLYEAVVAGIPRRRSLGGHLAGLRLPEPPRRARRMHWPASANSALATTTRVLFASTSPANHAAIDQLEASLRPRARSGSNLLVAESIDWGRSVASAVMSWSRDDGGHDAHLRNFPSDHEPPVGPGLWEPTPPDFLPALQPTWGRNRTFAVGSGGECGSGDHPPYSERSDSAFFDDAVEVYETVLAVSDEQREIASFWSDDPGRTATPPGHSISILNQVATVEQLDLATAAECYLKVGFAVSDAFVTCWNTKYQYNLLRPITYVRAHLDAGWSPLLPTPPFPEYTSGHSVQSGAAFAVMGDIFGDAYELTDRTHDRLGLAPRSFTSFSQAADEAAISRLYGGIHFRPAIELGLEQGRCVARAVARLPLT